MTRSAPADPVPNHLLREERKRRGWTQQQLADAIETTVLNISRWERGITTPNALFRQKLCDILEKSSQELGLDADIDMSVTALSLAKGPIGANDSTDMWYVPHHRNPFFTGREDILALLYEAFMAKERPVALVQPQAISGLGGIGKTQTAIEYAYRYHRSYQAVFWVRAESPDLLVSDYMLIAKLLSLPERDLQDEQQIAQAVVRWFNRQERWLLILDNADNPEMLSEYLPAPGRGHILLTTRAHSLGSLAERITIEEMDVDEGTLFLLRRSKRLSSHLPLDSVPDAVRAQAAGIVIALGGLPLALDQAAAFIEETQCSLRDYLLLYQTWRTQLLQARGEDDSGHPEAVATTWSLSFDRLQRDHPPATGLLRLCAFLHPDKIPLRMIEEGAPALEPVLRSVIEDEFELNEAIGALLAYSLIQRDTNERAITIHRLVQAITKSTMDRELERAWAERAVRLVSQAILLYSSPQTDATIWPIYESYLPHAQTCADTVIQWRISFSEAGDFFNLVGTYLSERGRYDEATQMIRIALALRQQAFGQTHLAVAESLNALAEAYDTQGKYAEAKPLYQQALAIREELLGPNHPDVAHCLGNLAWLYREEGRYAEAEECARRSIAICEEALGPLDHELAISLNSLGAIYHAQGKYAEAEPFFQRALAIREQFPTQPLGLASSLNNLAAIYRHLGKYAESEQLLLRALPLNEQLNGPDHPDVSYNLTNLASLYSLQSKYQKAEPLMLRALDIRRRSYGPSHPATLTCLNGLAKLYTDMGRYEEAGQLFQKTLTAREQVLGVTHPDVATTLENYAALLSLTHRQSEAAEMEARARAIRAAQSAH